MSVELSFKNVIICERFAVEALAALKKNQLFQVKSYQPEHLATAHVLIIRSKFKIDRALLDSAPQLEVIITCTSGFDHIDLEETKKRSVVVMYTPEANMVSTAEHTWALLLACSRQVVAANRQMKSGEWLRDPFVGMELAGKTLGIVGFGRIGQRVCRIAQAFDMNVISFDPYQQPEVFDRHGVLRLSYDELLRQSDIITYHVPATDETHQMLNRSHFDSLNGEQIIINASRGNVIREEDLVEALQQKKIKTVGLDVFQKEPLPRDSQLLKFQNIVLTPHLGALTNEAFLKASLQAVQQLEDYYLKNQIQNTLPLINDWGSLSFQRKE